MDDLEKEFRLLMEAAIQTINSKESNGEFSTATAQHLRQMVENHLEEELSRCPLGHTGDCGWSSSMGYHCY